jgi:hypothetical protein
MTQALRLLRPITITSAMLTAHNVPEPATGDTPDPAAYSAATTYTLAARCHVASTHMIYESVQAGNIAHDPTTDTTQTWWVVVGATNRWRMFDQRNTSQTTRTGGMDVSAAPGEVYNGIALLNMALVNSVQVTMVEGGVTTVYDTTTSLQDPPTVGDYYEYCFDPILQRDSLILTDLPSYGTAVLRVKFFTGSPSDVASVGVMTVGRVKDIGRGVHYGAKLGIQDYSVKQVNAYGDYTIVERAYSKRTSFEMWVPRAQVDSAQTLLASVRAVPCVWIGSDYYKSTIVYGFFKDFETTIAYFDYSVLNISLEGLT